MALHRVRLPPEAKRLFLYVVLIKRLLNALADQNLVAANVNEDWVKAIWSGQPDDWVHQFCLRGQLGRIQAIAEAKSVASVCPYCDESLGSPKLDHYYAKYLWPLLAISPWNLIPVCNSCNELIAKADRPALSVGSTDPAGDWLHPIHRPSGATAVIELSGPPTQPAPSLASPDAIENTRLAKHFSLIRTLGDRWTRTASSYFDSLVRKTSQQLGNGMSLNAAVQDQLNEHEASRGLEACSMTKAAVCRAVLSGRAEYVAEFTNFNPPQLN